MVPRPNLCFLAYWDPSAPVVTLHLASGLSLKLVKDFKYLGTWLVSSMHDFKTRRAAVWSAIRRLNRIWTSTALFTYIKLRLFNSLVVSILLYNAVTWTMNKTLTKALTGGYNRLLRYALNIRWSPGVRRQISNAAIHTDNHLKPIATILRRRRLTFADHCYRSFESAPQPVMDVLFLSLNALGLQNAMLDRDYTIAFLI